MQRVRERERRGEREREREERGGRGSVYIGKRVEGERGKGKREEREGDDVRHTCVCHSLV
jgi:hypothetical protein